ncbi:FAD-dependent oxidoreductase [Magnetovibrio sp. PR-2]|uniref:NAD(P)/FAD-dependent oxidoreductase n=1 Tax=Magnetovibrio sp. PR-2 TaxID=3120356 RepID=UPI002FCE1B57
MPDQHSPHRLKIAVVGTGIAGMSAAWLLSQNHDVTVFEKDDRIGGHTNTVDVNGLGVDTGFIVYNVANYPNLIALFDHLGVATHETDMSFGVSVDQGAFEYSGGDWAGLFAQKRNLLRPRFWAMVKDVLRFYRDAPDAIVDDPDDSVTLGQYLDMNGYSQAFQRDHLLPMGAAIWSTPVDTMLDYPLNAFLRFCDNHGLLQVSDRPQWRSVVGGSQAYVKKLTQGYADKIVTNAAVSKVTSNASGATVEVRNGIVHHFDHVVMASHADQSLQMLEDSDPAERKLLEAFSYQPNKAILHNDASLMPKNKKAWSSWNYLSESQNGEDSVCVTYWMNRLQNLDTDTDYFVTLNPTHMPAEGTIQRSFLYHHPMFDRKAVAAQRMLWNIQGQRRLWFCGSYFGHGFHEDALQSGLAVGEALGGVRRPWSVDNESGRINLPVNWPQLIQQVQDAA